MPYTPETFANNVITTVVGGTGGAGTALNASDTSLLLPSGVGAELPTTGPCRMMLGSLAGGYEIVTYATCSGDTLSGLVRGLEGTTALTWAFGTPVQQVATAGSLTNLWKAINQGRVYIVEDYGAVGNGTTDDTSAIQAAITACQNAGGGVVKLAGKTYKVSTTMMVSTQRMSVMGDGWTTKLLAASGMTGPILQYSLNGTLAGYMGDCSLHNLQIDGNSQSGVTGLQLDATYHFSLFHVWIHHCGVYSIYGNGNNSFTGAYTNISHCHIEHGTLATSVGLYTNFHEWGSISDTHFDWFDTTGAVAIQFNNGNFRLANVGFDKCDTCIFFNFSNYTSVVGCQFERTFTRCVRLRGATYANITGSHFGSFAGTGSKNMIDVDDGGNRRNVISGCTCNPADQNGNLPGWASFVSENGNTGGPGNLYANNDTGGLGMTLVTGIARGNRGYNPRQSLAAPAAPTLSQTTTGGTVAAGTYQVEVTYVTAQGETTASASASIITTTGTSTIKINSPTPVATAYGWYAYVTQPGGGTYTRQQTVGSPTPIGNSLTLTAPPTNTGANPPGANTTTDVTTPAVPATTVAVLNTTGVDVTVYVAGGTVSAITIGNKATGLTSGAVRLPANQAITLTYTVAPTWTWIGE